MEKPGRVSVVADNAIPDPAAVPFDAKLFEKNVTVELKKLGKNFMEFDIIGVAPSVANAVPTMAIETVFVVNNTSIIPDEVLSHRLGLIPIHADPRKFDFPSGDPTDVNTIVFEIRQKCTSIKGAPADAQPEAKYVNSSVYSSSIKWMPQGSQEEVFSNDPLRTAHEDILVTKLRPGQEIDLELHCIKGCACATYRLLPRITITSPITGKDAQKFASCFPEGVIEISKTNGVDTAFVKDSRRDTVSRECLRHPEFADKVILSRIHDHFIYFVAPNQCIFTNADFDLPVEWETCTNMLIKRESVADIGVPFSDICLLDSESPHTMHPDDSSRFTHFLFGGILGNTDEFDCDKTSILRKMGFPTRNLGNVQMTTDTALRTTKKIIEDKLPFETLKFVDRPEIYTSDKETLILNFRFLAGQDGEPIMAPGIRELLIKDAEFDYEMLE